MSYMTEAYGRAYEEVPMASCNWCGVERDAPAAGPHVCEPSRVREQALRDAACEAHEVCQGNFGLGDYGIGYRKGARSVEWRIRKLYER